MTMIIVAGFHVKRICVSTSARRHASLLFSNKLNCIETLTQFQIQILLLIIYRELHCRAICWLRKCRRGIFPLNRELGMNSPWGMLNFLHQFYRHLHDLQTCLYCQDYNGLTSHYRHCLRLHAHHYIIMNDTGRIRFMGTTTTCLCVAYAGESGSHYGCVCGGGGGGGGGGYGGGLGCSDKNGRNKRDAHGQAVDVHLLCHVQRQLRSAGDSVLHPNLQIRWSWCLRFCDTATEAAVLLLCPFW